MKISILTLLVSFISIQTMQGQVGYISTIAGTGANTNTGDGGPATAAEVSNPQDVCTDLAGNIYFSTNSIIRKINTSGVINTYAGNGTRAFMGDGGQATAAELVFPGAINCDTAGNLFINDDGDARVRKVNLSGIINTVAGSGATLTSGNGGPATAAGFEINSGVAPDGLGNIYVSEASAYASDVRVVNTAGIINMFAGGGGTLGDSGPATAALVNEPGFLCTDRFGNVYIGEYGANRVRKVNTAGIITTVAGNGSGGFSGDGGPATDAKLNGPDGVAVDGAGNVYISDYGNERVRKVNIHGMISTVCGDGIPTYNGDARLAVTAEISNAQGVCVDCAGNIYIGDLGNNRIRKIQVLNNAPYFDGGHSQHIFACEATPLPMDSVLAATDLDTGQILTWMPLGTPTHGTITVSYTMYTTGGAILPPGIYYTPAPGYIGTDSFRIMARDCGGLSDTTMVYVTINATPNPGVITGTDSVCIGHNVTLSKTVTGGVWGSLHTSVAGIGTTGVVTGVALGIDTIIYTTTSPAGCTASAVFPIKVYNCPTSVPTVAENAILSLYPDPAFGACTINSSTDMGAGAMAELYDMQGRRIKSYPLGGSSTTISLAGMAPGMYFCRIYTHSGGNVTVKKLVVE